MFIYFLISTIQRMYSLSQSYINRQYIYKKLIKIQKERNVIPTVSIIP